MARGHTEVGGLVRSYTRTTSSAVTAEREFCEDFRATIPAAVTQLDMEDIGFMGGAPASGGAPLRARWGGA